MTKEKNQNHDELDKSDIVISSMFVITLVIGLIISGIAFSSITS
jgi:hypothetical protein